jgi:hypothetical protein
MLDIHKNSGETNWDVQNIWATYPGKLKTTALLKLASLLLCIYETGCLMCCHIFAANLEGIKNKSWWCSELGSLCSSIWCSVFGLDS